MWLHTWSSWNLWINVLEMSSTSRGKLNQTKGIHNVILWMVFLGCQTPGKFYLWETTLYLA